jgi:hypothetical protein
MVRALSSEVDTGSLKKTRQTKNLEPRSDSIGTEKALVIKGALLSCMTVRIARAGEPAPRATSAKLHHHFNICGSPH